MERTITAILTNSNDKKVFTSNANTLGELKAEMSAQGIDYAGMDFMEGLTHTTMMDDASILPSNVQYKGQVTNNLVFMLSTANKNIRSGADRNDLYAKVKEYKLEYTIKQETGKNFTQVSSAVLEQYINNCNASKKENKCTIPIDRNGLYNFIKNNNLQDAIKNETGDNYTRVKTETLYNICVRNAAKIKPAMKSPYSDKELDAIINSLRY